MWKQNWIQFLGELKGLPANVQSSEIAAPASEDSVSRLENVIGSVLPTRFRTFLRTASAGMDARWEFKEGILVQLQNEREPIPYGGLTFNINDFLLENPQFRGFEPDPYTAKYRPADLLAFSSTPNGDQFAVVLTGPNKDSIRYLSHDLDDIHFYKVGEDIISFLANYARIGFAGPEYWIWEQFTNGRKTPIDSESQNASEFLKNIVTGTRSANAEATYKRSMDAARRTRFTQTIVPEARRLLTLKEEAAFIALLSEYSDLLSDSLKARYDYLLKKRLNQSPT